MNRVLSWPHTSIVAGLLSPLKTGQHDTVVTERHTVRFELPLGPVEMSFIADDQRLPPGTRVRVWLKGGGFVCASIDELKAEAWRQRSISRQVQAARARLEAARQERVSRDSAMTDFDALPPQQPPHWPDHPLLQA